MRLVIGKSFLGFLKTGMRMSFLLKIHRFPSTLIDKVPAQVQVFFFACFLKQPHQRHFCDLMPGIAVLFPFLRADMQGNIRGKTLRDKQQLLLPRCLVPGNSCLRQMTETIQLMMIPQVGKLPVPPVQDIISIQISVLRLGIRDQTDRLLRRCLQLRIRMHDQ